MFFKENTIMKKRVLSLALAFLMLSSLSISVLADNEEQQNVFVRRYWYFDSVEQIAKVYGFSQSKVKTMLFRMRADLKNHLEKEGYDI